MRFGQVHGAGPVAGHHLGQIFFLQLLRGVLQQRGDGALRQPRIHGERHIGRAQEFIDHFGQGRRQALAAEFLRHRNADPAAFDDLLEGVLEAGGRGDAAVGMARAAFLVADAVERREHFLAELGRLAQDRLDQIGRGVGKARQVAITVDVEDVIEQKQRVVDGRFIGWHRPSPWPQATRHKRIMTKAVSLMSPERRPIEKRPAPRRVWPSRFTLGLRRAVKSSSTPD